MPTQLTKLALVNTSTLSETLTFSVFQEGSEEASRQVISIEPNSAIIENEREIYTSKMYDIMVSGAWTSGARSQLTTWKDNQTELVFTGYGLDGSILQAEGTVQSRIGVDENLSFSFSSMREGKGGYNSGDGKHSAEISYCQNGLALYKWQEGSTADLAAGWSNSGDASDITWDSVNGEQDYAQSGAGGAISLSRTIYFPFAKDLTFSIDVTAVSETTAISIEIEEFNASDVSQGSTTNTSISTGREEVTHSCSSSCEYVVVSVNIDDSDTISFKDPVLGLNGNTAFVEFNT